MKSTICGFVLLLLIIYLITSCSDNRKINNDVFFLVEPLKVSDTIVKVMLINNTSNSYFITMSRNRSHDFYGQDFDSRTNNSVVLKPLIYNGNNLITLNGLITMPKINGFNKGINYIKKDTIQANAFYKDYISLKNAIFLKSKSSRYMEIPFYFKFRIGYTTKSYDLEKDNKYDLQLEYQMSKEITEENISKSKLDSVQKLGYAPYYEKIVSNKVPLIIK